MYAARPADAGDDLDAFWSGTPGYCRLNPEQVLVVTDDAGALMGAAVMYHGGHAVAYVGAVKILPVEHPQWVARALWKFIAAWCKDRGVTMVGHGAGTEACMDAMERLGGKAVRIQTLYEVAV